MEPLPAPRLPDATRHAITVVNYVLAVAALVLALVCAKVIVISALVGLGIGVILAPALDALERRRVPRAAGTVLLVALAALLLWALGYSLFSMVESQIASLWERMPELVARLQGLANRLAARYPWVSEGAASIDVAAAMRTVGANLFKGAWSGFAVAAALVFSAVIGLYTAAESTQYHRAVLQACPAARRETFARFLAGSAATIRNWFRAQLIDMAIMAALTSLALWAVGADYWLLFGVLTGLFGIIPYVGIALVIVFASVVTLAGDPGRLPWVLGVFIVTQQLEGHLILPLVMRDRAQLPAVPLLVFMLVLGSWGGLLGVLMAPPLFAVLLLAYRSFYLPAVAAAAPPEDAAKPQSSRLSR